MVPAVAYYEALREMEQLEAKVQIARLKQFCLEPKRFPPLTTEHLESAAVLWGEARRMGQSTADPKALDVDVILAAQAKAVTQLTSEPVIVATTNVGHLSRFVVAELWSTISL